MLAASLLAGRLMRIVRMLVGLAFVGWCVYGGIYLPAKYGSYGAEVEEAYAREHVASSVDEEDDSSVGEDNIGESLDN